MMQPVEKREPGRPRSLTLQKIIEAGKDIGLQSLSISAVAAKLGVRPGTIYTYVSDKNDLEKLVTEALMKRPLLEDIGQHWSDIVRSFAGHIFYLYSNDPELTRALLTGSLGPEESMPLLEHVIGMLVNRGIELDQAFELCRRSSQIAAGAGMTAAMSHALERRGDSRKRRLERAFFEAPEHCFPHLRQLGTLLTEENAYHDYKSHLEDLIMQYAKSDKPGPP